MPYYTVTSRTTTTNLNWRQTLQNGPNSGPRAVLAFAARKGITRVPMGYLLNGPVAQVLGTAVVTDGLSACESILLVGCDAGDTPQHVAFSHVRSGDPNLLDWTRFTAGIIGVQQHVYAVVDVTTTYERPGALGGALMERYNLPLANILIYISSTGELGRSFGVDGAGNVGEVDAQLVKRNTAAKLDGSRSKAGFLVQSDNSVGGGPFSVKIPK